MTYQRLVRLAELVKTISDRSTSIFSILIGVPLTIVALPFAGIWYGCKWLYEHIFKKKVQKITASTVKPHVTPKPTDGRFLFKEDRELKIPVNKVAYIETVHDKAIQRFLEEEKAWLQYWQEWYGIEIISVDNDSIRQGMVFPQDFTVFKHGFLWQSNINSGDGINNGMRGDVGRYYELDPKGKPLKEQMKDIANLIYKFDELEYI